MIITHVQTAKKINDSIGIADFAKKTGVIPFGSYSCILAGLILIANAEKQEIDFSAIASDTRKADVKKLSENKEKLSKYTLSKVNFENMNLDSKEIESLKDILGFSNEKRFYLVKASTPLQSSILEKSILDTSKNACFFSVEDSEGFTFNENGLGKSFDNTINDEKADKTDKTEKTSKPKKTKGLATFLNTKEDVFFIAVIGKDNLKRACHDYLSQFVKKSIDKKANSFSYSVKFDIFDKIEEVKQKGHEKDFISVIENDLKNDITKAFASKIDSFLTTLKTGVQQKRISTCVESVLKQIEGVPVFSFNALSILLKNEFDKEEENLNSQVEGKEEIEEKEEEEIEEEREEEIEEEREEEEEEEIEEEREEEEEEETEEYSIN